MSESTVRLADLASVVRSKNAGPFVLTLDVFFRSREIFQKVRDAGVITRARLSELYGVRENDILEITFFEPADALKISIKRWVSSAAPGDTDVFGAQQHVPLMSLGFELEK
ncbi:MAG: DUF4387 domain-containing protein [Dehalococcoidia bacterium]